MQRLIQRLPRVLQEGPNIRHFLYQVAVELTLAEEGLTTLSRSRWYRLARGWGEPDDLVDTKVATELGGLAGLFGVEPLAGESTQQFRKRLRWLVDLHREGLTTARAILHLVAMVYLPDALPKITWEGDVAVARLTVNTHAGPQQVRLELRDNPKGPARCRSEGMAPGSKMRVVNAGLDSAIPEIRVTAREKAVTLPQLTHKESDLHIVYLGTLEPRQTLTLRHRQPPVLAGRRDETPVVVYNPCSFNEEEARFAFTRVERGKSTLVGGRFSVFEPKAALPALPTGISHWTYHSIDSKTLTRYLKFWSGAAKIPKTAAGEPATAAIDLELRWQESLAGCFEVCVPPIVPLHMGDDLSALTSALERMMAYGRAAGVQARLTLRTPPIVETIVLTDDCSTQYHLTQAESLAPTDSIVSGDVTIDLGDKLGRDKNQFYASGKFDARAFDATIFDRPPDDPETNSNG